jgi:hypothetical protein
VDSFLGEECVVLKGIPDMPRKQPVFTRSLIVVSLASILLLLILSTQWWLVDWLTPFLIFPAMVVGWAVYLSALVWSLSLAIFARRSGWPSRWPLTICAMTFLVACFVPFTKLWIEANYFWYKVARERIVEQVRNGTLRPNVSHNRSLIALPSGAPYVSMGGNEIEVQEARDGQKYVFFFTYRGILDNYAGFLFVPDGGAPTEFSDLDEARQTELMEFGDQWFWVSHR